MTNIKLLDGYSLFSILLNLKSYTYTYIHMYVHAASLIVPLVSWSEARLLLLFIKNCKFFTSSYFCSHFQYNVGFDSFFPIYSLKNICFFQTYIYMYICMFSSLECNLTKESKG